jgi:hypothetical protein
MVPAGAATEALQALPHALPQELRQELPQLLAQEFPQTFPHELPHRPDRRPANALPGIRLTVSITAASKQTGFKILRMIQTPLFGV